MGSRLNSNLMIRTLASDLGVRSSDDPVGEIITLCHRTVAKFLLAFPHCTNPAELLRVVADQLKTEFRQIHTDADLAAVRKEFLDKKESGFITLHEEMNGEVLGITLKRVNPRAWDLTYVSIIDCRGTYKIRSYYTMWHELVHLLILTDQNRLVFRRTHTPDQQKTPEEALVDVIAGTLAFYPPMVQALASGEISFDEIERLRLLLCPSASRQSALLGITKAWPRPCILLDARLAHKAGEHDANQQAFDFKTVPPPTLRAIHVTPNDAARKRGIRTIPRFRVPAKSIIHRVFNEQLPYAEAIEELSSWSSSDGMTWSTGPVIVKARYVNNAVQALLIPISSRAARA